jgi:DeoR/GlpR family transcriptional regulator of sugar metabolism
MKSAQRHLRLRQMFSTEEFIEIEALCHTLGVSESTVRRDLTELESRGLLRRVHGGAISLQVRDEALDFGRRSTMQHEEKVRIGRAAAMLVNDGETLILGGGSTAVEVAHNLFGRPVQIITNSIPIAQVFWDCKSVEVTLTGGYLYPRLGAQLGPICEHMLSQLSADTLIMGIGAISEAGLSDSNTLIVGSVKKMIDVSRRVIIVADHTKFGRGGMVHLAPLEAVDVVVTDRDLAPEYQQLLRTHDLEVVLA